MSDQFRRAMVRSVVAVILAVLFIIVIGRAYWTIGNVLRFGTSKQSNCQ